MATKRIRAELCSDDQGYTRCVDPDSLPKRFYAVAYTWRQFRLYSTKGAAQRGLKAWKRGAEMRGYNVTGSLDNGYRAHDSTGPAGAAVLHTYIEGKRA
jgi:hypothetical protein